jgi:MoxR-like ATPase
MARVSESVMKAFETKVIKILKKEYESGMITHELTRGEISELVSKYDLERYPRFIVKNKSDVRGRFDISGYVNGTATKVKPSKVVTVSTPAPTVVEAVAQVIPVPVMKKKIDIEFDASSYVPAKDPNYVRFGYYKDLKAIVDAGMFFPVYISGPTGNGKTMMVEQVFADLKKPLIRINMNVMTDEDQLIGTKTLVDGNVEIVEGVILLAMRHGLTVLIDEIDAGGANALMCLQSILEGSKQGKPYYFKLKNEVIYPKAGFNILACANTKGQGTDDNQYVGTNVLNGAFLERFVLTMMQEYPPEKVEREIVGKLMQEYACYNEKIVTDLVKWSTAIRITYNDGGCNELVTTRRLAHIIKTYSVFKDITKAVTLCVNRFDDATRAAFINLFEKVHGGEESVSTPDAV